MQPLLKSSRQPQDLEPTARDESRKCSVSKDIVRLSLSFLEKADRICSSIREPQQLWRTRCSLSHWKMHGFVSMKLKEYWRKEYTHAPPRKRSSTCLPCYYVSSMRLKGTHTGPARMTTRFITDAACKKSEVNNTNTKHIRNWNIPNITTK